MLRDLIVAWVAVFLTFHDSVIWQNILQKKNNFFWFTFQWLLSRSDIVFLTHVLFSLWAPLVLIFCTDWNSPFVLCYCMFSLRRQKRIFLQHLCSLKARIETSGQKSDSRWVSAQSGVTTSFVLKCQCRAGEECQRIYWNETYVYIIS